MKLNDDQLSRLTDLSDKDGGQHFTFSDGLLMEVIDSDEDDFSDVTGKCTKCGCVDLAYSNDAAWGSEWTGPYGSVTVACIPCGVIWKLYQ